MRKLIEIVVDGAAVRRWHVELAEGLRARGFSVAARAREGGGAPGLAALLLFEATLSRGGAPALIAPVRPAALGSPAERPADLVLDLSAAPHDGVALAYDGACGEVACLAALIEGRAPRLDVLRLRDGRAERLASARPAIETPRTLGRSLAEVARRALDLLHGAATAAAGEPASAPAASRAPSPVRLGGFALSGLARKITARLTGAARRPERWSIGFRWFSGDAVIDALGWPDRDYLWVADDGRRYYADPFVFHHARKSYIFCEEFPYATGKATIAMFEAPHRGAPGLARTVLEEKHHLSYPHVFARDGAVWMIPEASAGGGVDLYRADPFPERWTRHARLIDAPLSDATLCEEGGLLWLMGTRGGDGGSSWDALDLYFAERLEGPWRPHSRNPVLIDAGAARPAGPLARRAGVLWRPAQDCRLRYGGALALARVDALTPDEFRQSVESRLEAPPAWRARGVHTLGAAGGLEVVDRLALA